MDEKYSEIDNIALKHDVFNMHRKIMGMTGAFKKKTRGTSYKQKLGDRNENRKN